MKKIKCAGCSREWYVEDSDMSSVMNCPYCVVSIREKEEMTGLDTLGKAIYKVITDYGMDSLAGLDRIKSFLLDIAPELNREICVFSRALAVNEKYFLTFQHAFNQEPTEAEASMRKLKCWIQEDGFSETWANMICENCLMSIRYYKGFAVHGKITAEVEDCKDKTEGDKQSQLPARQKVEQSQQIHTTSDTAKRMLGHNVVRTDVVQPDGLFIKKSSVHPVGRLIVGQRNVKFGKYNWRVLDVQDGKALLLMEYVIGNGPYYPSKLPPFECIDKRNIDHEKRYMTWETREERKYLNGDFLQFAFNESEQMWIAQTLNKNENNQWYGIQGGADTIDKVFFLSIAEAVKYFGDSGQLKNRKNYDGNYADPGYEGYIHDQFDNERTAVTEKDYNPDDPYERLAFGYYPHRKLGWYLRSPGRDHRCCAYVTTDGSISMKGEGAYWCGFRPALWLKL